MHLIMNIVWLDITSRNKTKLCITGYIGYRGNYSNTKINQNFQNKIIYKRNLYKRIFIIDCLFSYS